MSHVDDSQVIFDKKIALVTGDGAGPEMMAVACAIAKKAAEKDNIQIVFEETPMGWNAWEKFGDTLPKESFERAMEIGTIFFGGVGDPKLDNTIGVEHPEMKPEARCLLTLRKKMGLLLNFRPVVYYKELAHLANVKPETIPEEGITQVWIRFLLEDSYFGNEDLMQYIPEDVRKKLGIKLKKDITGDEDIITDLAYYRRSTLQKYLCAGFTYARQVGLPVISIDKANVIPRYAFWRINVEKIRKEFPDVQFLRHQYSDSANEQLFNPALLHGVMLGGNEHLDIISDGAIKAMGGMGMMCSSAINPDTVDAMFESGAGTAPTLAGQNKANPLGRILTGAMMLRHIGAVKGAKAIDEAVRKVLKSGCRTVDMIQGSTEGIVPMRTSDMGEVILSLL